MLNYKSQYAIIERLSNEDVYHKIHEMRSIWTTGGTGRNKWIGHLLLGINVRVTSITEGKIEGQPGRGRPIYDSLDSLICEADPS